MTLLLNFALPFLLIAGMMVIFQFFGKDNTLRGRVKLAAALVVMSVSVTMVYTALHTSYIPRTGVAKMPAVVHEAKDLQIQDNLSKPEERKTEEVLTVREEVKEILESK